MAAMTGTELLAHLGTLLNDPDGDIWDSDLKVTSVNEALKLIVSLRPDAMAITEALVLAQTAKQSIPSGGLRFLDIPMNTGGLPVRKVSREELNESVPDWSITGDNTIEYYMFDEENPKTFWVYPVPNAANVSVDIIYSTLPATFLSGSESIGIDDIYLVPVVDYVLSRCFGMMTKGADFGKAASHKNSFFTALGVKTQNDALLKQVQES